MSDQKSRGIKPKPVLFLRVILVVLLVTGFTIFLEYAGWLKGFELAALDSWTRARLHLFQPSVSKNIIIVSITDQDYQDIFAATSPLDAKGLEGVIKAIASGKPAVIGIDIDTSDKAFRTIKTPENVSIVWAMDAAVNKEGNVNPPLPLVLGGTQPQPATGIAKLPIDDDGIVRAYVRKFGSYDSFEWRIAKTYCASLKQDPATKTQLQDTFSKLSDRCDGIDRIDKDPGPVRELSLDLIGDRSAFEHVSARKVLDAYSAGNAEALDQMRGAIVLVGGLYYAARDAYTTPVGRMAGVELMAHSVGSELRGGGLQRPAEAIMFLLNLVGGIGILFLFIKFGLAKGCLFSGVIIILVAPLWSLLVFSSFAYTIYFLPIFFALLVHQLYEQAHYYEHALFHELSHRGGTSQAAAEVSQASQNGESKSAK